MIEFFVGGFLLSICGAIGLMLYGIIETLDFKPISIIGFICSVVLFCVLSVIVGHWVIR